MDSKKLQRAIETVKSATREELLQIALCLAAMEHRSRCEKNFPMKIHEQTALLILEKHINHIRIHQREVNMLAAMDVSAMVAN